MGSAQGVWGPGPVAKGCYFSSLFLNCILFLVLHSVVISTHEGLFIPNLVQLVQNVFILSQQQIIFLKYDQEKELGSHCWQ